MIEKYLRLLLLQHDQVVVEQIGTFTAHYENSRVSEDGKEIAPPRKIVSFSQTEKGDHELLRQAVLEGEKISPAEYEKELAEFQEKIQYQLSSLGRYEIQGLGTIFRADGGGLSFEQAADAHLLPESFGLPLLNRKNLYKTESKTQNPPQKVEPVDKKKSSELVWWLVIIPLVFLLAFVGFLFSQKDAFARFKAFFGGAQQEAPIANNNTPVADTTQNATNQADTTAANTTADNSQPTVNETPVETNKEPAPQPVNNPPASSETDANGVSKAIGGRSYIIAASFSDAAKAVKLCEKYKGEGYAEAKVIHSRSQNSYRVTLGEDDDPKQAASKMAELAQKVQNLWIMQYK